LFELDTDSQDTKQVQIIFDMCKRNCNTNLLNLSFNCSLDLSICTFFVSGENDWWVVEKIITELVNLTFRQLTILNITINKVLKVSNSGFFIL